MKKEFYFPSKDGNTEIHTVEWEPEGEVKAVLQLCHGMVEYIERYEELAEYQESKSLEELADLLEVMRAVVNARGWTLEELERVRADKAAKRGGFEKKILLKEVMEN